jgi:hypothetical protein
MHIHVTTAAGFVDIGLQIRSSNSASFVAARCSVAVARRGFAGIAIDPDDPGASVGDENRLVG